MPHNSGMPPALPKTISQGEAILELHLRACGLDKGMVRERRFHPERKWRFDFAWPAAQVAVEVEGATQMGQGRHSRGKGFEADTEKYNEAARLNWRVFRFTTRQVKTGAAVRYLESFLPAALEQ